MARFRILIKPGAARELEAAGTKKDRARFVERIRALGSDPRPRGCEKLAGREGVFRVRVGVWRVLYRVDDPAREIHKIKVGHRRDVYR